MHQAAGELNESRGYLDAAIREYREVLALDPDRPGIHFLLGRVLLSRSRQYGAEEADFNINNRYIHVKHNRFHEPALAR